MLAEQGADSVESRLQLCVCLSSHQQCCLRKTNAWARGNLFADSGDH